jgi:photosystem II stability/assembly factor-like uncharacterized protein
MWQRKCGIFFSNSQGRRSWAGVNPAPMAIELSRSFITLVLLLLSTFRFNMNRDFPRPVNPTFEQALNTNNHAHMKHTLPLLGAFLLLANYSSAQWWQSMGPAGGSILSHVELANHTLVGTSCGIYRTSDNGDTFYEHSQGIPSGDIISMIEDDGVIIACIRNKGLYRSTDGGVTWSLSRAGNYLRQDTFAEQDLLRLDGMTVARNYGTGDSLYFTSDEGLTWTVRHINNSLFNNVISAGGHLFTYSLSLGAEAGVYRSSDMGQSWQFSQEGLDGGTYPANIYEINGTLYLLDDHVYSSTNEGVSWTQETSQLLPGLGGVSNSPVWSILHDGRFYCQNGGNFNVQVASWAPGEAGWQAISEIPTAGNTQTFYSTGSTVCLSRIEGQFRKAPTAWETYQPFGINGTAINGLFASGNSCLTTTDSQIRQIDDQESVWSLNNPASLPDNLALNAIVKSGNNLLLGRQNTFGALDIMRSIDDGVTWAQASSTFNLAPESRFFEGENELYVFGELGGTPYVIGLDQSGVITTDYASPFGWTFDDYTADLTENDDNLYALTTGINQAFSKILRWELEGGTFWNTAVTQIDGMFFGARCLTTWQGKLYLGLSDTDDWDGGVRWSEDGGVTWTTVNDGIEGVEVNRFLASGDSLFAATKSGVYVLASGTTMWEEISGNLPVADIIDLSRSDWYLYARLENGGAWRLSLSDEVNIAENPSVNDGARSFPNPTNGTVYISGLAPGTYHVKWYDAMGKFLRSEAITRVNQPLDVSEFAPGNYVVHIESSDYRHSIKVTVN